MWIKSIRVRNYKSFDDSGPLEFDRHMNVIVGANHSGKSALLSAVAHRYRGTPHKSSRFRREEALNPTSTVDCLFANSGHEVRDLILRNDLNLQIPVPRTWTQQLQNNRDVLDRFLGLAEVIASVRSQAHVGQEASWSQVEYPSTRLFVHQGTGSNSSGFIHVTALNDRSDLHLAQIGAGENDNFGINIAQASRPRIYLFDAQRVPQNSFNFGSSSQLMPNAANLAEVLNVLRRAERNFPNT